MKTKYKKVSVADRLPEKEGDYFCVIANGPSIMTCRSMYFERFKGITHWLEEVPDYEEEILLHLIHFYNKRVEGKLPTEDAMRETEALLTKIKQQS